MQKGNCLLPNLPNTTFEQAIETEVVCISWVVAALLTQRLPAVDDHRFDRL